MHLALLRIRPSSITVNWLSILRASRANKWAFQFGTACDCSQRYFKRSKMSASYHLRLHPWSWFLILMECWVLGAGIGLLHASFNYELVRCSLGVSASPRNFTLPSLRFSHNFFDYFTTLLPLKPALENFWIRKHGQGYLLHHHRSCNWKLGTSSSN